MAADQTSPRSMPVAGAAVALVLLTALNFVNYADRYILPGVQELIKQEFHVSDSTLGSLTVWFFITYMIAAPATGWLGDHLPRKPLIVACALLISGINVLTGYVHAFDSLLIRHAALGIGEASFGIFAPALLADFYPEQERNRVLTIFYTAIPVGAAIGVLSGEILGNHFGWRMPFYVSAVPGFLIGILILFFMKEPVRGGSDGAKGRQPKQDGKEEGFSVRKLFASYFRLFGNGPYMYATLGMAMVTFSLGGISFWMPTYLQRAGFSPTVVGIGLGAIIAGAGLGGTAFGGWLAQQWLRSNYRALYLISAWSALLAVPPAVLCFFGPHALKLPMLFVALFCIFLGSGPLNAAIVNAVPAAVRATAIALELFLIHAVGDTPSPKLIGFISDRSNLGTGLAVTLVTMVIASVLLFVGSRIVPRPGPRETPELNAHAG